MEGWVSGRGEESQERGEPALPHLPAALEVGLGGGRERSPRQGVSPAEGRWPRILEGRVTWGGRTGRGLGLQCHAV